MQDAAWEVLWEIDRILNEHFHSARVYTQTPDEFRFRMLGDTIAINAYFIAANSHLAYHSSHPSKPVPSSPLAVG